MFDLSVFALTVETVAFLLIFLSTGFFLRRKNILGKEACSVLSFLTSYLFLPAYTLNKLPQSFTVENLGSNAKIILFACAVLMIAIILGRLAAKILHKNERERRAFSYLFAFSNTSYFGLPVVEGVFGEAVLGQFIIFTLPFSIAIYSYGWGIFASKTKFDVKKCFLSPTIIATYIAAFLGLTGLSLPSFVTKALAGAGNCMSPSAMLLAGLVMGAKPLKELLCSKRSYFIEAIRLITMPLCIGTPLYLAGFRGVYLFLALLVVALPAGMNVIVFPESQGQDATENSTLVFISTILSLIAVPLIFTFAKILSGFSV